MANQKKAAYTIYFKDVSGAEAGEKARTLRQNLLDASPNVSVEIKKDDTTTQDFGTTLVLVLGTPAVLAIAKGIESFLKRNRGKLVIESDGMVIFEGGSEEAARIVEALQSTK